MTAPQTADDSRWDHIDMLENNVLVRQLSEEELELMKESIIVIPGTVDAIPDSRGVVVRIGPGSKMADGTRAEMASKEGDMVVFRVRAGQPMRENKFNCYIMRQGDVLCKIRRKLNG